MSNLLQDIVKKVRLTTYQELDDTVNKNLGNLDKDEKIKLEQDQIKIIEIFKSQAIFEIACLQRRLININKELFEIQKKEMEYKENLQNIKEEIEDNKGKLPIITIVNNTNENKGNIEKEKINNTQDIYLQKDFHSINSSNSQDFTSTKTDNDSLSKTYSHAQNKKKIRSQRKNPVPKKNSDSQSTVSLSKREIKHMEKNSDLYCQTISKYERDTGSQISHEKSQKSYQIKCRKRIEREIYKFREEVKNINNSYPKRKKI